jgi:hypothetical protein
VSEEKWWKFRGRLQLALVFVALTVAGAGVILQITHVARPLDSVLLLVGVLGYALVVFRQVLRRSREDIDTHAPRAEDERDGLV